LPEEVISPSEFLRRPVISIRRQKSSKRAIRAESTIQEARNYRSHPDLISRDGPRRNGGPWQKRSQPQGQNFSLLKILKERQEMINNLASSVGSFSPDQLRMIELAQQGFHCSEILLFMGLEAQGKTNPDLIRTVSALAGGVGFSGETCGALTGGACLLGLYAGRGTPEEQDDPKLKCMIQDLVGWFSAKHGEAYGGIRCRDITQDDPNIPATRCPRIVGGTYQKVRSILSEYGFDWERCK
ncbi:MAG: DVU_1555 family C-GCAxxG-C-C protein, partial [Desulfomonilaceae bacterium]